MFRTIALSVLCVATVTACATQQNPTQSREFYREQGLRTASVSGGACDSVGQIIVTTPQYEERILEASAMPTR